ncbi:MAG: 3-phosphoshikimate 1-carboxyvinyltransferase [Clostridiales bacterium]|nr:3-phosphoshikimate 1-carboxyvinyltransferase [Clostridiales bacterium]
MTIKITKPLQGGTIGAIASKSQAHRLLICAALSSKESQVNCSEKNNDINATVRCLNALGALIIYESGVFSISPIKTPIRGERILDCGESGSTLRFMLPVVCALGADAQFRMGGRLPSRPLSPLYEELMAHGCAISPYGMNPLHVSGYLKSGRYTMPGNISSQFISGLMFALPLLSGDSMIMITGDMESKPYIDMTISALKDFGVVISQGRHSYTVKGKQHYTPGKTVDVEGDWSNAAVWLCAGAVGSGELTVTNLNMNTLQGDRKILDFLECFGARVNRGDDCVTVMRGELRGIDIDAADTPDLVPVLAAVASVAKGTTFIRNAGRLRIKETDRLQTVTAALSSLGADIIEAKDDLIINGRSRLNGGTVVASNDHRLAMLGALAATVCDNPVTITDADAVNKSYPEFFSDFAALGGIAEEVI